MVGVFYAAPAPGAEPFVHVGSKVKKGETLCVIEAMKVMNEVTAEADGEVVDICVKDGDLVEYGLLPHEDLLRGPHEQGRAQEPAAAPRADASCSTRRRSSTGEAHGKITITGDEFFVQGHFPGNPIVPGVIQCEMLAQNCCVLL